VVCEGAYEDSEPEHMEEAEVALCTGLLSLSYGRKEYDDASSVAVLAVGC